ncbi:MAG: hypothetical protein AAGB12_15145 [Pseudomonadota bacterium]
MLYILVTVVLISLSLFILLPKFNHFTERYSLSINYCLTLIATLVGVLLAISITNIEADRKEKQDLIKLLKASITSVETSYDYTESIIEYYNEHASKEQTKKDFFEKNRPPYPDYLDAFIIQNIVSKNLSGHTLSELNEKMINLKRSRDNEAQLYLSVLNETRRTLLLELSFQKNEIDESHLEKELDNL